MFNLLKRKKNETIPDAASEKNGWFSRIRSGLAKTRARFSEGIAQLVLGKKELDADVLEEIETCLLTADTGVDATRQLIDSLTLKLARKELADSAAALNALQAEMISILQPCQQALIIPDNIKPFVILVVGVNGAGKTTTIGKLAHHFKSTGKKVMLAAGDTFRAAAIDQLQAWGERNQIPVIAQQPGADTAAVIHDAMTAASARGIDILIADTAGRLHTQDHLMAELKKVVRVIKRIDDHGPHETLLVLDAGNGQNALNQARQFHQAIGVTGIALTKLDGTAKGGIIFAIARTLGLPIRYIGVGEGIEDLRPFDAEVFVPALFENA